MVKVVRTLGEIAGYCYAHYLLPYILRTGTQFLFQHMLPSKGYFLPLWSRCVYVTKTWPMRSKSMHHMTMSEVSFKKHVLLPLLISKHGNDSWNFRNHMGLKGWQ